LSVDLLESGLDLDGLGRFSVLGARPLAVATAERGGPLELVSGPRGLPRRWEGDPLAAAAELLERLRPAGWRPEPGLPFSGGGVLTLAYDLGRRYEQHGDAAAADGAAPDLHLAVYGRVLCFDHTRGEARLVGAGEGLSEEQVRGALDEARGLPAGAGACPDAASPAAPCTFTAEGYRAAVVEAKQRIRDGELFEVNLSRRWTLEGVEPDLLFEHMRRLAPAPFMADLDLGRGRRLLSASPERFLRLAGGLAESWPIKGTRPRGDDPAADARLGAELLASEKDGAELAMIVDLVRNDLGRVATPGTVRVRDARRLQSWPTVHHTVAVVEGQLAAGRSWAELVRAAFPPGSVTGAPKVRAMQVIDAQEPVRRGLYCGAYGHVGFDGDLDLAVAIRVVPCAGGVAHVHAGGAVLLDSEPAAEERETLAKAGALLRAARASVRLAGVPRG
jgi:para-aminobenzoate synthetase component 1